MKDSPHIGINGRFFQSPTTGVERHAYNITKLLIELCSLHEYRVSIFGPKHCQTAYSLIEGHENCSVVESNVPHSGLGRHMWDQFYLPHAASQVTVLVNLANTAPLATSRKNVVTIHDVAWLKNPQWFSLGFNVAYSLFVNTAARGAQAVITVSESARRDIIDELGISPGKVFACWTGASDEFFPAPEDDCSEVLAALKIVEPYFLFVGTIQPRKNLNSLIEAHAALKAANPQAPRLVIVGGSGPQFSNTNLDRLAENVTFLGRQSDSTLRALYTRADAYISASSYEAFGLPLVESMACGTPVIVSSIPAHREVCGDAGTFFELGSQDSIVQALNGFLAACESEKLERRRQAVERSTLFSWQKHAQLVFDVIQMSIHQERAPDRP